MTSIVTAANLACVEIYKPDTNAFDKLYRVDETVCGRVMVGDVLYLANQGTANIRGILADADVAPFLHPVLGNLHSGFYRNIPALIKLLMADVPRDAKIVVTGHSKGAGESIILGAMLHLAGYCVDHAFLFACPNAGHQKFTDWLAENIKGVSLRNAPSWLPIFGDPVALVPTDPHQPPYPHTMINVPPPWLKRLIAIYWHSSALYLKGVSAA